MKTKEEFRREMAEAFANVLEEKGLEWRRDWTSAGTAPANAVTGASYRGTNSFWLSFVAMTKGYGDSRWCTMVQIADRYGRYHPGEKWHLKEGSKAAYVEYWYPYDLTTKRAVSWEYYRTALKAGRAETEFRLAARYTPVFNVSQVEGVPEPRREPGQDIEPDGLVRKLSLRMGVTVLTDGGASAWYSRRTDSVHVPLPERFESPYSFNSAVLHELAHSTGHPSRLARPESGGFGTPEYAYEELVAEMTACFSGTGLADAPGEMHLRNHRAYVKSWAESVRADPALLVRAVHDAQKAALYMDRAAELITAKEYSDAVLRYYGMRSVDRGRER